MTDDATSRGDAVSPSLLVRGAIREVGDLVGAVVGAAIVLVGGLLGLALASWFVARPRPTPGDLPSSTR